MNWPKLRIRQFLESNKKVLLAGLLISLCALVWSLFTAQPFEWKNIQPIPSEAPQLKILSALVFVSFGNLLYRLGFYQILYFIFVIALRNRHLYEDLKWAIWHGLMFFMGWVVVPWVADILNQVISIFYNIFAFFVYLVPSVGIALSVLLVFNLARHLVSIKNN